MEVPILFLWARGFFRIWDRKGTGMNALERLTRVCKQGVFVANPDERAPA